VQNDRARVGNGCGRPGGFPIPELIFTPCCDAHDICYSTCSESKRACDAAFHACLKGRCADEEGHDAHAHETCLGTAGLYALGVTVGGQGGFDTGTKDYCTCRAE
jgi:secretory phospholipase A2